MKLINPTDDQLDEVFATEVAGWRWKEWTVCGEQKMLLIGPGMSWEDKHPNFTRSADAVLPWLEKASKDRVMFVDSIWFDKLGDYWTVEARKPGQPEGAIFATDGVLPRAAVIALLRAHGVEVVFK